MSEIGFAGGGHASTWLTWAMERSGGTRMMIGFLSQGSQLEQGAPLGEQAMR